MKIENIVLRMKSNAWSLEAATFSSVSSAPDAAWAKVAISGGSMRLQHR
jgi:hypothetical protein